LGVRKSIWPVKNLSDEVLAWLSVWSEMHMVQLMPLQPIISCFIKIPIHLTFLVPVYPGCPGKEAVKWVSALILVVIEDHSSISRTSHRSILTNYIRAALEPASVTSHNNNYYYYYNQPEKSLF